MASGDIINNQAISMIEAGSQPTWNPVGNQSKWAKEENSGKLYYYNSVNTTWNLIDLDAISGASLDGNDTPFTSSSATKGVAPTTTEVPSPINGDTASKFLIDGVLEKYVYISGSWSLAYTLEANQATNLGYIPNATNGTITSTTGGDAIIPSVALGRAGLMTSAQLTDLQSLLTVVGSSNDTNLSTFTGSTISDNRTIKQALQDLETALEGQSLDNNISNTQDNEFEVTLESDGLKITKQTLLSFNSHTQANASNTISVGDAYILDENNLDGVVSDGTSAPVFRK